MTNHALQQTRTSHRGCHPSLPRAGDAGVGSLCEKKDKMDGFVMTRLALVRTNTLPGHTHVRLRVIQTS
ncbi:MAG: hypothetical protein AYP45_00340 [Candidatus Brocadia carolinensis]|uniref:Uncharacterized protein n=1 Tax=Candidatus Brocadia carolinensis TaxID=1004156 RepID=A0A1V4AY50_9BACT|nr:MAG: hypothetical protein AYP45_00340 [Candidatus Brocadia caroliniensis]